MPACNRASVVRYSRWNTFFRFSLLCIYIGRSNWLATWADLVFDAGLREQNENLQMTGQTQVERVTQQMSALRADSQSMSEQLTAVFRENESLKGQIMQQKSEATRYVLTLDDSAVFFSVYLLHISFLSSFSVRWFPFRPVFSAHATKSTT